MDVKTYIQQQMNHAHRQVEQVVADLSDGQFNWLPPGTICPISAILIHTLAGEDFFINNILQGKTRFWESQGWADRVGVPNPPSPGHGWQELKTMQVRLAPVLAYAQVVQAATQAYLAGLTPEVLDQHVDFAGRKLQVAEVLMMSVVHTASHAGEMSAIKGIQGVKGLPF